MNIKLLINYLRPSAWGGYALGRKLTGATLGSLVLALSSKTMMLVASVLLGRILGPHGFGIYSTAMAVMLLLNVPTTFGLPILVVRMLAAYAVREQWGHMRGLLRYANIVVLTLTVSFAMLVFLIVARMRHSIGLSYVHALWWTMALLVVLSINDLRSAALRGLHHVVIGQLPDFVIMPVLFLLSLGLWVISDHGVAHSMTPAVAIALRFVATFGACAIGIVFLRNRLPRLMRRATPEYEISSWLRASGPLLLIGSLTIINTQTDVIMLATLRSADSAGIFRAASRGAELVGFSIAVANMAIQPTISRLYWNGDIERLQRVAMTAARLTLLIALPVSLVLIIFGRILLGFLFGSNFESGAEVLTILCLGQVVSAAAGMTSSLLNMTGHERDSARGMMIGAATNVLLNLALIPPLGMTGAAIASGISLVTWNGILIERVVKKLGIDPTALGLLIKNNG